MKSDAKVVTRGYNEGVGVHSDPLVTGYLIKPSNALGKPESKWLCFSRYSVIVSVIIAAFDLDLIRDTISQLFVFDLNVVAD